MTIEWKTCARASSTLGKMVMGSLPAFIVLIIMAMVPIRFSMFCSIVLLMLMMIIFIAVVMKAGLIVVMVWMIVSINASSKSGC